MRFGREKAVFFLILSILARPSSSQSAEPFQILLWNGFKAATSLTFDDGDPIHLDLVIPEMNRRGLQGTFFLIAGRLDRVPEWKKASQAGQEIGNHTLDHKHVSEFKPGEARKQVEDAKAILEKTFGIPIYSFAYPFNEITPELSKIVETNHFIARAGPGTYDMKPDDTPDWSNIPSRTTTTDETFAVYQDWIDQDLAKGTWNVWMIHGVEGTPWGYQPIPRKIFIQLLDYLVKKRNELWVAPFSTVGAYWRAQKTLESVSPLQEEKKIRWKWAKPSHFPAGVILKARIDGPNLRVSQGGKPVEPLSAGIYPVAFDALELTVDHAPWKAADLNADLPPATSDTDPYPHP